MGKTRKRFEDLPLEVQNFVKIEVDRQVGSACDNLRTQNEVLSHERSFPVKLAVGIWSFIIVVAGILAYLIAPGMIYDHVKKMVDSKLTVPEIDKAAQRVLSERLDDLANEKMVPFERRAAALQDTLQKTEVELSETRRTLSLMTDMNLAQTFDRAAYERVKRMAETNSGPYAAICKMVAESVNERLVNERDPDNFFIKTEVSFKGEVYRGPFTMDEIYCSLRNKDEVGKTVSLIRLDKHRCFYGVLLDIATTSDNLKTAENAMSVLEKLGAPSGSIWDLKNASNWVASASVKDPQFPSADYDSFLELRRRDGLLAARWAAVNLLPKFKDMDKTRTMAVVEALSRNDIQGANRLSTGYHNASGRWKQVSECYYMSATGCVSRATDMLLKCNASYPSIISVLDAERYWAIGRWFDVPKILKGLGLKQK